MSDRPEVNAHTYVGESCTICGFEITDDWVYTENGAAHPTCADEFGGGLFDE